MRVIKERDTADLAWRGTGKRIQIKRTRKIELRWKTIRFHAS